MIYTASATILTSRFVKISGPGTVAQQNSAGAMCMGISQDGGREAPVPLNQTSPVEAARVNETLDIKVAAVHHGQFPMLTLGTGGITAGQLLMSDANGAGVLATTGLWAGAIAEETGVAGDTVRVFPVIIQLN